MRLYVIDNNYIKYLKQFDSKVPDVDYQEKYKLFIGKINIGTDDSIGFYIPITSVKPKFLNMPNRIDFIKIQDPIDDTIVGAIDINNMIPVPDFAATQFSYEMVRESKAFDNDFERQLYYDFSKLELFYLNNIEDTIIDNAKTVYSICKKDNKTALKKRSCDFVLLYQKALDFQNIIDHEIKDLIQVISDDLIEEEEHYRNINKGYSK